MLKYCFALGILILASSFSMSVESGLALVENTKEPLKSPCPSGEVPYPNGKVFKPVGCGIGTGFWVLVRKAIGPYFNLMNNCCVTRDEAVNTCIVGNLKKAYDEIYGTFWKCMSSKCDAYASKQPKSKRKSAHKNCISYAQNYYNFTKSYALFNNSQRYYCGCRKA